jgi:hypothetical protein
MASGGAANAAPVVATSEFAPETQASWMYVQQVQATDPNGDLVGYALVDAPPGMAILSLMGVIYWAPTLEQVRDEPYQVTVLVSDGKDYTLVNYSLKVVAPPPGLYAITPEALERAKSLAVAPPSGTPPATAAPAPASGAAGPVAVTPSAEVAVTPEAAVTAVTEEAAPGEAPGRDASLLAANLARLRELTSLQWLGVVLLLGVLLYGVYGNRRALAEWWSKPAPAKSTAKGASPRPAPSAQPTKPQSPSTPMRSPTEELPPIQYWQE